MIPALLVARPGYVARVTYQGAKNRIKVGSWMDMADPRKVWEAAQFEQRKQPSRPLRLDVMSAAHYEAEVVQDFDMHKEMGLGAAPAPAPQPTPTATPSPAAPAAPSANMSTALFTTAGAPAQAAMTPQIIMPNVAPMSEPPPGMDAMSQFIFREQGRQLQAATFRQYELQQLVQVAEQEKAALKTKLDEALMDLRHKERENKQDIRDMETKIRDEYEQSNKPTGMGGLVENISTPGHPLAALLGLVTANLLPKGAASGAPSGQDDEMTQVLTSIGELLPDAETGVKLYMALSKIMPHPNGLAMIQQLASSAEPLNS